MTTNNHPLEHTWAFWEVKTGANVRALQIFFAVWLAVFLFHNRL
jgi:hypothetical protein